MSVPLFEFGRLVVFGTSSEKYRFDNTSKHYIKSKVHQYLDSGHQANFSRVKFFWRVMSKREKSKHNIKD